MKIKYYSLVVIPSFSINTIHWKLIDNSALLFKFMWSFILTKPPASAADASSPDEDYVWSPPVHLDLLISKILVYRTSSYTWDKLIGRVHALTLLQTTPVLHLHSIIEVKQCWRPIRLIINYSPPSVWVSAINFCNYQLIAWSAGYLSNILFYWWSKIIIN